MFSGQTSFSAGKQTDVEQPHWSSAVLVGMQQLSEAALTDTAAESS